MSAPSAAVRELIAAAKADCKTATERVTKPLPWQPKYPAIASTGSYDPVKVQVSAICIGIEEGTARAYAKQAREHARRQREELVNTTGTHCADLLEYAAAIRLKPTPRRMGRDYLTDGETRRKMISETGFDLDGHMCEPPQQQWERPQAMPLYSKLMVGGDGKYTAHDFGLDDFQHLAWMIQVELIEIDADARIRLLSDDKAPDQRLYPGFPVDDKRAAVGRTHKAEDVQNFVMEVWGMTVDGHPPMDIASDYRQEMTTKRGLRMSGRMMTYQCNKLLAARIDANCNCLGRDLVNNWWELPDHGTGCAGRERALSVPVVRRAIRALMEAGELERTDQAYLTRRNHTEHRVPAAYAIPADAGWHAYVKHRRTRHPKPKSALEKRLFGDPPTRQPNPYPVEYQDSVWDITEES